MREEKNYMAASNHIFLASMDELTAYKGNGSPALHLNGQKKDLDLDPMMLSTLEGILTGENFEDVFDREYVMPVIEQGPEGPWAYCISTKLTELLSALTEPEALDCAEKWSQTDDWTLHDNLDMAEVCTAISTLSEMSRQGQSLQKLLFIWTNM